MPLWDLQKPYTKPNLKGLIKTLVLGMKNLLSNCWLEEAKRFPKQNGLLLLPLVAFQKSEDKSLLLKIPCTVDTGF